MQVGEGSTRVESWCHKGMGSRWDQDVTWDHSLTQALVGRQVVAVLAASLGSVHQPAWGGGTCGCMPESTGALKGLPESAKYLN